MTDFTDIDKKTVSKQNTEKDPSVEMAINLIQSSLTIQARTKKMDNITEDKELYNALSDAMKDKDMHQRLNNTLLMQTLRLVSEDSHSVPAGVPYSATEIDDETRFALQAVKRKYSVEGKLKKVIKSIMTRASTQEGTSFLFILPERYEDKYKGETLEKLNFKIVDSADVCVDPRCTDNIRQGDWVAFKTVYKTTEAPEIAKNFYGFEGELSAGDVMYPTDYSEKLENTEDIIIPEETTFYTMWHKSTNTYLVFAGENGDVLQNEKIPYKDSFGMPDIPVFQYDATVYKDWIYAASYTGVAKDIAREDMDVTASILPQIRMTATPLLAGYGVINPKQLEDDIADALAKQEQGLTGLISMADTSARISPLLPGDITAPIERISTLFDNKLAKRLGLSLNSQEKQVNGGMPTATQIIQQAEDHAKAIANQNKINAETFYAEIYNCIINYARILFKGDKGEYKMPIGTGIYKVEGKDLYELIKSWRGEWIVDTSVDIQLTQNQKVVVMDDLMKGFIEMTQMPFMSTEEIKPIKDILLAKIQTRKLDSVLQREDIDKYFEAIINKNAQQQEQQIQQEQAKQQPKEGRGATENTPPAQKQAADLGAERGGNPEQLLV